MTHFQRVIKYLALLLAFFLTAAIIFGGIGLMGTIFGISNNSVLDEMYSIELSQNIEHIDIDVSAASLKIVLGDKFALSTNIGKLNLTSDSTLKIKQRQHQVFSINNGKSGEIILTIPADVVFKSFELDAGAGSIEIERLNSQSVEIDAGAGSINIKGGEIERLDLDLGVGKANITSAIKGKSNIDCGVGETNINLIGKMDDYTLDIDTGIGSITLNGTDIKGNTKIGNGQHKLEIDGGVGVVNINFVNE